VPCAKAVLSVLASVLCVSLDFQYSRLYAQSNPDYISGLHFDEKKWWVPFSRKRMRPVTTKEGAGVDVELEG